MKASVKAKTASRQKQSLIILGCLLAAAIALNVYQFIQATDSVLNKTHAVHKEVVHQGTRWTELRAVQEGRLGNGQYELWRTSLGIEPKLVDTFDLDGFSNLTWEPNEKGGITVSFWSGGPEAGSNRTIVYDTLGNEKFEVSQNMPNGKEFTFEDPKSPSYTVSYITDGGCVGDTYNDEIVPDVRIRGISLTNGLSTTTTREFLLSEESTVKCDIVFDVYDNPPLRIVDVSDNEIHIELANGKTATIVHESRKAPEVVFNE